MMRALTSPTLCPAKLSFQLYLDKLDMWAMGDTTLSSRCLSVCRLASCLQSPYPSSSDWTKNPFSSPGFSQYGVLESQFRCNNLLRSYSPVTTTSVPGTLFTEVPGSVSFSRPWLPLPWVSFSLPLSVCGEYVLNEEMYWLHVPVIESPEHLQEKPHSPEHCHGPGITFCYSMYTCVQAHHTETHRNAHTQWVEYLAVKLAWTRCGNVDCNTYPNSPSFALKSPALLPKGLRMASCKEEESTDRCVHVDTDASEHSFHCLEKASF